MGIRVIAGSLRRKNLFTVAGMDTRPTSDRIRESIFNIVGDRIRNADVLDLFSGTGAMGIEALSRGARHCVFVENAPLALDVIRRNIAACDLSGRSRIQKWNIEQNLDCLGRGSQRFAWIFMDPPYNRGAVGKTLRHLRACSCMDEGTTLVVEHSPQEPVDADAASGYMLLDQRRYGKTLVSFLCPVI